MAVLPCFPLRFLTYGRPVTEWSLTEGKAGTYTNIIYISCLFSTYTDQIFLNVSGAQSDELAVIREIYDGEHAQEQFELELERALDAAVPVIVIEPTRLGDETARWIAVGNCLHKTAVLTGLGSICSGTSLNPFYFINM